MTAKCRNCENERARIKNKSWRVKNPEKVRSQKERYYQKYKDKILEQQKADKIANPEKYRIRNHEYYEAHKEIQYKTNCQWRIKHRDRYNEMVRKCRASEHGKLIRRINEASRRARKENAPGSYSSSDVIKQYEAQRGLCWWCSQPVQEKYHIDHVIPLSRGGSNNPGNIVIACPTCNISKSDKLPQEWAGRLF